MPIAGPFARKARPNTTLANPGAGAPSFSAGVVAALPGRSVQVSASGSWVTASADGAAFDAAEIAAINQAYTDWVTTDPLPDTFPGGSGFEKFATVDFTGMTPTIMNAIGITVIDGVDFDVDNMSGTSLDIDATGAHPVGGTGPISANLDLATIAGLEDLSDEDMIAIIIDVDDAGDDWGVYFGQSINDRVGIVRATATSVETQRRIGGALVSSSDGVALNQEGHSLISCGAGLVHRFQAAAPTSSDNPLSFQGLGNSAGAGGGGWKVISAPGGILRIYFTNANSRNVSIRSITFWRVSR